ncbi:tRNA (N6-threonylcarbamoyladenosine(37)-N6)-methyltransferase TrmO [Aurantimonas sp. C2-6-R+9]|uniref:tRNA (N6-threonylcarbamoyladenosine(37)-N6)-methyltransferase TrmO n=1 Tax=unclassified Aurantimonas TaxID=2638230 RepID=UPI002E19286F|nr:MULTISPECIES: tRNA (N6-threonylcarbamoyladenosine(37)-N6)-methyltransferase TrmO [unclassified Aurantimonas]MEC5290509.1 tRNA (N6-threonylcarbamoyladenosine(37)-N6)-methyltransferase TrmO [Aurantimonas sp. C2-3-R2]MEC5380482.1 tRNA (N6-threonylcarbamoyladenosine(37)-N6)-methyltransferase TrmO [Aurantimonas sp. C2-6-R+9]MEC5411528.1 tRNA (N6-threonylcarbamoyladenosine(37)-N6)-methyltransferase TrmO [Aurantimonas sp. C2-4-R8]
MQAIFGERGAFAKTVRGQVLPALGETAMTASEQCAPAVRPGEVRFDGPEPNYDDAGLVFIGLVRSPWASRDECPKNLSDARERGQPARVEIDARWRGALTGLDADRWVFLLTWLDGAERDLALQAPRHADGPRGTFTLRSPVRPNPIGLHLVRLLSVDLDAGILTIDAIDVRDGTPLVDIKPYLAPIDAPPE